MEFTWKQSREGHAIKHTLVGTPFSIIASGESVIVGYQAGGNAHRIGKRRYVVYNGERKIRFCDTLTDAKQTCERRA